jgi:hypothetical protein
VNGDLLIARVCRAAALAAVAGCIPLALDGQWLAFALVLWIVPGLLIVGGLCHLAHTRALCQARVHDLQTRTSTTNPRKDTPA